MRNLNWLSDISMSTLDELRKWEAERSLLEYTKLMWSVLEPGRELVVGKPIEMICEHLEAVTNGHVRKLLMNVPPGFWKSMGTNVFWPSWEWGPRRRPELRYISASYSQDLTVRDNRRCRQLIQSEMYQRLWGDAFQIVSDQDAKVKFENDRRGWKIATSVGGAVVGERGDRFVIDDPHNIKVVESEKIRESTLMWFTEVVPTRVNDPEKSVFVVIMQRVHERDVSGLILARELGYDYLCVPMEWETDHPHKSRYVSGWTPTIIDERVEDGELAWKERFSARYVAELKEQLRSWGGGYAEAGQLQQRPAPRGGGMFQRQWWRFYARTRENEEDARAYAHGRPAGCSDEPAQIAPIDYDWIVMSVDAAFKASTSGSRVSIMVIGGHGPFRYVLENKTAHMTFRDTCEAIAIVEDRKVVGGLLSRYKKCSRVLIEDKANGSAIIDTLRQTISGVIGVTPEGGKESRASAIQPTVESGHVLLPENAPWLVDFVSEFASFPVGARDDQVDALSQALIYMTASPGAVRARMMANW